MRITLLLSMLLVVCNTLAQDQIYTIDGKRIEGRVIEVGPTLIKYKKQDNLQGPDYIIEVGKVLVIAYENGSFDSFGSSKAMSGTRPLDSLSANFGRNFLAYNVFEVIYRNVYFSYEHILPNGKFGVRIPLIIGFGNDLWPPQNKVAGIGLELNVYPHGQGRIRYYFAPAFEYGTMRYRIPDEYVYDPNTGMYTINEQKQRRSYYQVMLNNGVLFQPSSHWNMSLAVGLGLREIESIGGGAQPYGTFGANIGYKF